MTRCSIQFGTTAALIGACGALALVGPAVQAVPQDRHAPLRYELIDLGTLGGPRSTALAMNDSGMVVGWSDTVERDTHAFVWADGVMTDLGTLGGAWSEAVGVNGRGEVIGISATPEGDVHPFLWTGGRLQDLNYVIRWERSSTFVPPRAAPPVLFDVKSINDNGWIVGCGEVSSEEYPHGFVLVPGDDRAGFLFEAIDLGALPEAQGTLPYCINDDNVVVGLSGNLAFQWERGVMIPLDQFTRTVLFESRATGISDAGLAVGWYAEGGPSAPHEACMWRGGTHQALGAGGGVFSEAAGVNGRDQIVGWSLMEGGFTAVLWEGRTVIDLNDVTAIPVRPPNSIGWFPWERLVSATAVDERGWIAGYGQATDGTLRGFVLKPVHMVPAF